MHELEEQTKSKERAIDSLPYWMRQMLEDKMQRCLKVEAEERLIAENNSANRSESWVKNQTT